MGKQSLVVIDGKGTAYWDKKGISSDLSVLIGPLEKVVRVGPPGVLVLSIRNVYPLPPETF